jgi:dTDP-4-dehydrorhamnose reductase
MKILITGSGGMLGYDLYNVLSDKHELVGVDINPADGRGVFHQADITDGKFLSDIFTAENPDVVIHTAAWTDVDGCELDAEKAEAINVTGTLNVARAVKKAGACLIALSTDYVFDGTKGDSYSETDDPNPVSVYGRTKLEAENIIREVLDSFVILRTSALYGRNGKNFVDTVITRAMKREEMRIVGDQITSPTYTYDLAVSIRDLINRRGSFDNDILNVCNSGGCSWYAFALKIIEKSGIKNFSPEQIKSGQLNSPAARPAFSVLDNTAISGIIGYKIRTWQEALENYIQKRGEPSLEKL